MEILRVLIHNRLTTHEGEAPAAHPDEDTMCAFVEGRLEEAASTIIVSHLIECGLCRRTTAQLSRIDSPGESESELDTDPFSSAGSLLDSLVSHAIPLSQEDTVFAYQNPAELDTNAADELSRETEGDQSSAEPSANQTKPE